MRTQSAASQLAATWVSQLRQLIASLRQDPAHRLAWLWRIRMKVLIYLISRYGDEPDLDAKARHVADELPSQTIWASSKDEKPVRSRMELRRILDQIAEINQFKLV